jgi:hypothetical protein
MNIISVTNIPFELLIIDNSSTIIIGRDPTSLVPKELH